MAELIKQVMTKDGPKQIDYTALANLPTIDDTVTEGSKNAVQGGAVYAELTTQLAKKLDAKDGKAADSILFGGQSPEYYVSNEDLKKFAEDMGLEVDKNTGAIESLGTLLATKLDATAQAADSAKLGGQDPDYYANDEDLQALATYVEENVTGKMGHQVEYALDGTTLTITSKA